MLLIDTDVWVDHLRSFAPAVHFVEGITDTIAMSVITFAELCAGAANHHEEHAIETLASICTLLDIDHEIARRAGALWRGYLRSHAVQLPDALIAATSQLRGARLVTLNRKHYPMLPDVLVPYRKRA